MIGDEVRSGCWVPLVQALAKVHGFVDEDFGLSPSFCFLSVFCFALIIVRFFAFSFAPHFFLLDSQSIPPILGSHRFFAFLASVTAFLHLASHQSCGGSLFIVFFVFFRTTPLCELASVKAFWITW